MSKISEDKSLSFLLASWQDLTKLSTCMGISRNSFHALFAITSFLSISACSLCSSMLLAAESKDAGAKTPVVPFIVINTPAKNSREARFCYRLPKSYDPTVNHTYRVLVYFGGRNTTGEREA